MTHYQSKLKGWLIFSIPALIIIGLITWSATRPRPGQKMPNQGNQHLNALTDAHQPYNTKPPTSGPHVGNKAPWGVSDTQIPDELQAHNLEDGGVIVHYDPERVASDTIKQLATAVQSQHFKGKRIILEPYAGLEAPIVLTAWTRIEKLTAFDEQKIVTFMNAYEGRDHHVPGR